MRDMTPLHWVIFIRRFGIVVISILRVDCQLIKLYLHLISVEAVVSDGHNIFTLSLVHTRKAV